MKRVVILILVVILFNFCNDGSMSFDSHDFWQQTNGPYHIIYSLAINSSGHIFAGTDGYGVFRSTDNGVSWTQTSNYEVHCLAINSSEHIFVGTTVGVFRSIDNGDNWTQINTGLKYNGLIHIWSLAINSSGYIFAATSEGFYRSTDNGDNWIQTTYTYGGGCLAINSNGNIFSGWFAGITP